MKFGARLAGSKRQKWDAFYIDYKGLKKALSQVQSSPEISPKGYDVSQYSTLEAGSSAEVDDVFFSLFLSAELEKVKPALIHGLLVMLGLFNVPIRVPCVIVGYMSSNRGAVCDCGLYVIQ